VEVLPLLEVLVEVDVDVLVEVAPLLDEVPVVPWPPWPP
jgi:hypothetical protein